MDLETSNVHLKVNNRERDRVLGTEAIPALQLWTLLAGRNMRLEIEEDNQATILVARRGYSPKLRHISRTHKVNLGSIAEVLEDEDICIEYIDTNDQAADIFTKALTPNKWDNALNLLGISRDLPLDLKSLSIKRGAEALEGKWVSRRAP